MLGVCVLLTGQVGKNFVANHLKRNKANLFVGSRRKSEICEELAINLARRALSISMIHELSIQAFERRHWIFLINGLYTVEMLVKANPHDRGGLDVTV